MSALGKIGNQILSKVITPKGLPTVPTHKTLKAGPSVQHKTSWMNKLYCQYAAMQDHRGGFAKDLIKQSNGYIFDLFNIPEEKRNTEFNEGEEIPEGFHIGYTSSGTDGMERAIRAVFTKNKRDNVLVNTDNFSKVAGAEGSAFGREFNEVKFERGKGLKVGSEQFEELANKIKNGSVKTIHITENGTTTGVEQYEAITELVKIRNEAQTDVIIAVDAVSSQMFGRERDPENIPDIIYWGNQKDTAITSGTGNIMFSSRALKRAKELKEEGLDTGGKLGLESVYGKNEKRMAENGQTAQTPGMGEIAKQVIIYKRILEDKKIRENISQTQEDSREAIWNAVNPDGKLGKLGFSMVTQDKELASHTTHVLKVPEYINAKKINAKELIAKLLKISGIEISSGYGDLKESEFRICVYSANTLEQVNTIIDAIPKAVSELEQEAA
jgi:aspartate aminotransferase-like enzyme